MPEWNEAPPNPDEASATPAEIAARIADLEESLGFISALANCLHEHEDVFWRVVDNLRAEIARLKGLLVEKAGDDWKANGKALN